MIASEFNSVITDSQKNDIAVILGAGLNGDQVSERLKIRLDTALAVLKDNELPIIVSGGQGKDELISEAEAMKRYLVDEGIEINRIILEDQSTSTYENLLFSKNIIDGENPKIVLITSDYNMYRAKRIGKRLGMDIQGASATNSESERIDRIPREVLSVIKDFVIAQK